MRQMSTQRSMQTKYMLLQAELYEVDRKIEENMDRNPGAFNPEASDLVLRAERDSVLRKMAKYRR